MNTAAEDEDAVANLIAERLAKVGNMLIEFTARLHNELGGGAGVEARNVRDEVGNGEIGFVADAGDDGNFRIENGAGDNLFVEGPEIFDGNHRPRARIRTSTSFLIEKSQRTDNFFGGTFSLHAHGENGEMHVVKTATQNAERPSRTAAPLGEVISPMRLGRSGSVFCVRVEETFGFETFFELIERKLERADAERVHAFDVNLIFAALPRRR